MVLIACLTVACFELNRACFTSHLVTSTGPLAALHNCGMLHITILNRHRTEMRLVCSFRNNLCSGNWEKQTVCSAPRSLRAKRKLGKTDSLFSNSIVTRQSLHWTTTQSWSTQPCAGRDEPWYSFRFQNKSIAQLQHHKSQFMKTRYSNATHLLDAYATPSRWYQTALQNKML